MTTLSTLTQLTLVELAKRKAPDGSLAPIVDALAEENQIVQDAIWLESNDTFSNQTTRRSSEPTGAFRKLNDGVADESSKTTTVIDTIGQLVARSKSDTRLVDAAPNPKQFRSDEAMAFVKGMGKKMAEKMIYGNSATTPEEFTGLTPRLDAYADTNVINAGGSGDDTTSIYIVDWGRDKVHMVYGKGSKVGLVHEDLGIRTVSGTTGEYEVYSDKFTWEAGMVVRNQRSIGRIANIEVSGTSNIFNEDDLIDLLVQMTEGPGLRIYCNRYVMAQMWKRLKDKNNVYFTKGDGLDAGGPPLKFNGIPIHRVEQIVNTETSLTS